MKVVFYLIVLAALAYGGKMYYDQKNAVSTDAAVQATEVAPAAEAPAAQ